MKKLLVLAASWLIWGVCAQSAQADLLFSTSNTNALAGTNLQIEEGSTGSLFVWLSTPAVNSTTGNPLRTSGLAFSVGESNTAIVDAASHTVINGGRWASVNSGTLNNSGLAVRNHAAATFDANAGGISTNGLTNFVLHSTITFSGLTVGTTNIDFVPHTNPGNGVQYFNAPTGFTGNQWANTVKNTASITVFAIPEPASLLVLGLGSLSMLCVRRRV